LKTGYKGFCTERLVQVKYPSNKYKKRFADTVPTGYQDRLSEMGGKSVDSV